MVAKKSRKRKSGSKQALFTKIFWISSCIFLFIYLAFANIKIFLQRHENTASLKQLNNTVVSLTEEQKKLSFELGATASPEYLEKVAREEFGYKKEGEQVVVVKKGEPKPESQKGEPNNLQFFQNIIDWITARFK